MLKEYPNEGKHYKPEEIEYLETNVGIHSFIKMGKELGRSPRAIESKLFKMGLLNTKLEGGVLSGKELEQITGISLKTLKRWREKYKLPLRAKNLRYGVGKQVSWHIKPKEFWAWANKNRSLIDWTKYEQGSLVPEPKWLNEAIRESYEAKSKRPVKADSPWTTGEDERLWNGFYKLGKTQKQLAEELGRTKASIERRLARLRERKFGQREHC